MTYVLVRDIWYKIIPYLSIFDVSRLRRTNKVFYGYITKEILYYYWTKYLKFHKYEPLFVSLFLHNQSYADFIRKLMKISTPIKAIPYPVHIMELRNLLAKKLKRKQTETVIYRYLSKYLHEGRFMILDIPKQVEEDSDSNDDNE